MEDTALTSLFRRCMALPDGAPLSDADETALRVALKKAPYSIVPPILLLRHCAGSLTEEETEGLHTRVALLTEHRPTLAFAAYGDKWADFYPEPEQPEAKKTVDVIDTFLSTYGSCTPEEEKMLERMIFNPTPDYAEMLAREEQENLPPDDSTDTEPGSQDALINAFIRSQHPAAHAPSLMPEPDDCAAEPAGPKTPVARPEHTDDSLLSESLAKIFIKQGRYERAYEIISGLNLKFPKKSAYFADQLRFLQKLIINQRRLSAKNQPDATEKQIKTPCT